MNTRTFLEKNLRDSNLGILLDAGCGDAAFLDELLSIIDAQEVWGIDIDEDALSEARLHISRAGISCRFLRASSLSPNLPQDSFDSIIFQDLLHHLCGRNFSHQPGDALQTVILQHLRAMDFLLRSGGRLIISEYVVDKLLPPARNNRLAIHNIKAEVDDCHGIPHSYSMDSRGIEQDS